MAPFDIDDVVTAVADLPCPVAFGKDLALGAIITPDIPSDLMGNAGRLRQILVNLIVNGLKGLKFTDSGSIIVNVEAV